MREQNAPAFIERITCALQALRTAHHGIKIGPTFPVQRSSGRWRIQQTIQRRLLLVFTYSRRITLTLQTTRYGVEGFLRRMEHY